MSHYSVSLDVMSSTVIHQLPPNRMDTCSGVSSLRLQILICVDVTSLSLEVMVIYCHGSVLLRTWHYDDK